MVEQWLCLYSLLQHVLTGNPPVYPVSLLVEMGMNLLYMGFKNQSGLRSLVPPPSFFDREDDIPPS